jgi:hypothetical protein
MRPLNFRYTGPFTFHLILRARLVDFMAVAWEGSWQVTPGHSAFNPTINISSPMEGSHGYWCRGSSCHGPWLLGPAHLIDTSFNPVPNAQVCVYLTVHLPAASRLYFTLSPPHRSKQTMMGWMDDRTNGWMNDETNG